MKIDHSEGLVYFAPTKYGGGAPLAADKVHAIIDAAIKAGLGNCWLGHGYKTCTQHSVGLNMHGDYAKQFASEDSGQSLRSGWFVKWSRYNEPSDEDLMLFQMLLPPGL